MYIYQVPIIFFLQYSILKDIKLKIVKYASTILYTGVISYHWILPLN